MPVDDALIGRIEAYYDAAPRLGATAEHHGPLTLFVPRRGGFPLYARHAPTAVVHAITAEDVTRVRARQRALDLPEEVEWVDELEPSLGPACEAAGLQVDRHPLMVLRDPAPTARHDRARVELVELTAGASDDLLRVALAVPTAAFAHPGTAIGEPVELDDSGRGFSVEGLRSRLAEGSLASVLAYAGDRPVGVASMVLAGDVAEIVGVGTLPDQRRRGIAAATTSRRRRARPSPGCRRRVPLGGRRRRGQALRGPRLPPHRRPRRPPLRLPPRDDAGHIGSLIRTRRNLWP